MLSLVCVVLLVIFCAVNKRPYKRTIPQRTNIPHQTCLDPESVPLRAVSDPNGPIDPSLCSGVHPAEVMHSREFMQCVVRPSNHSACSLTSTNQSACSLGSKSVQFNVGAFNNGIHGRNQTAVIVSGGGYPIPTSSMPNESCLLNPVNHNLGATIIPGVGIGANSQQGCLVATSNSHPHIAPLINSGNTSSQINQNRLQTNR